MTSQSHDATPEPQRTDLAARVGGGDRPRPAEQVVVLTSLPEFQPVAVTTGSGIGIIALTNTAPRSLPAGAGGWQKYFLPRSPSSSAPARVWLTRTPRRDWRNACPSLVSAAPSANSDRLITGPSSISSSGTGADILAGVQYRRFGDRRSAVGIALFGLFEGRRKRHR